VNRLGITDVLRQVWKPLDGRELTISVHAGERGRESRGMRFIVKQGGQPLCCVKRLPLAGPYDTRSILETQKAYGSLKTVRVPEVLGCTQDDENWFIVEQFVPDGTRLDDAVHLNLFAKEAAEKLLGDLLAEIHSKPLAGGESNVDEGRVLSAIETSQLTEQQKRNVRRHVLAVVSEIHHAPVWTSRDFLPRNILLSGGQPYLVDFDLACKTGLLGMDVKRIEQYTQWQIPFWPADDSLRYDPRTRLLFFLLEAQLQRTIAGTANYRKWIGLCGAEIEKLAGMLPADLAVRPEVKKPTKDIGGDSPTPWPIRRDPLPVQQRLMAGVRGLVERSRVRAGALRRGFEAMGSDVFRGKAGLPRGWHRAGNDAFKFSIDCPGDWKIPDQATIVSGWCFSPAGVIEDIRAVVNGEIRKGFYGMERPDVMHAWSGQLSTSAVGFWARCPVRKGFNRVVLEVFQGNEWVPLCKTVRRSPYFPPRRRKANSYQEFIKKETERLERLSGEMAEMSASFPIQPLISLVMPVYRSDLTLLARAVESVRNQIYGRWELCIVDDASNQEELTRYLSSLGQDKRIKVTARPKNGNISAATNDGIAMAEGEWIAFLDHDDELSPDALYEVAAAINRRPETDIFYSDQDKIDSTQRRSEPFFKPNWSPTFFRGVMYLGHLLVARRNLIQEIGGCDGGFDGVQDFELALRLSEHTARIEHIPRVLYHWRAIPGSVAADGAAKSNIDRLQELAVQSHLDRLGIAATAHGGQSGHRVQIIPKPRKFYPKISILIPTRDHPELIGRCLKTIFEKTSYPNFEVLIGDNETRNPQALKLFETFPVRRIPLAGGFHFSRFNNTLAAEASGEYLMLLNNDTEIVQPDWLQHLLLYAEDENVGAAGALLTYADGTVQHAGIILGPRGTADHVMRGFPGDADGYMGSLACTREVTAVTAAAAMVQRRKYMLVGGFWERFQRHYDDLDFCLRLRSRGFRNICVSTARLVHHESRSRGEKYDFTDRVMLLDRWESLIERGDAYYSPNFDRYSTDYRVGFGGFQR